MPRCRSFGKLKRFPFFTLAVFWLCWNGIALADDQPTSPDREADVTERITDDEISAAIAEVDAQQDIDEETKAKLKDLYVQARRELEQADEQQKSAAKFQRMVESAAVDIKEASDEKSSPKPGHDFANVAALSFTQLLKDRAELDKQLASITDELVAARAEPQRRVRRRAEILEMINAAKNSLVELEESIRDLDMGTDEKTLTRARLLLLRSRRQHATALLNALQAESNAYAAQGDELPRLLIDVTTQRQKQAEQDLAKLEQLIHERRAFDASAQKDAAEKVLQTTSTELASYAQQCVDFAERRLEHAADIQTARSRREETQRQLARWEEDFNRTKTRAESISGDLIGPTLIEKKTLLPSISALNRKLNSQVGTVRDLQDEIYELEERRAVLLDMESAISIALDDLKRVGEPIPAKARSELRAIFELELTILDTLFEDANRHYSLYLADREDTRSLVALLTDYREFIDERILWVRSAPPLQLGDARDIVQTLRWFINSFNVSDVKESVLTQLSQRFFVAAFLLAAILVSFGYHRKAVRSLQNIGETASSTSCRTMRPTVQALLLTTVLAIHWPLCLYAVGWFLSMGMSELVRSISTAFRGAAWAFFFFLFTLQVCRSQGLGTAHFSWSSHRAAVIRNNLRLALIVCFPLALAIAILEQQSNLAFLNSTIRLCLLVLLATFSFVLHRLFRPTKGLFSEHIASNPNGVLNNFRRVWHPLIVVLPLILAVLAIGGYIYSVLRITLHLNQTFELLIGLVLLGGLVNRGVRMRRRRFRRQQLLESFRESKEQTSPDMLNDIDQLAAQEEEIDLVAMDRQTRQLFRAVLVCLAVIGLSAIWHEAFPALSPILDHELWAVEGDGGSVTSVTPMTLLLAGVIVVVAIIASRNVPGLIEIMLLNRLGMQSATRYAVSTLSQYAIITVGLLTACFMLGITWGKAQWLIAALGVGLGFGLQEIVANFVCGILLLFERPLRVGDTVTLGETTGVVVRIRTRATTIRNWDRQEVVIPNKELITGRIVNWSLSDTLNRIVITVGVAYGTDTRIVRDVLADVLQDNENILEDPKPTVIFDLFGESSLNFTVRAFLDKIEDRLETTHQLHTTIHDRFAEQGIEISFPQRDLHLRSVESPIPVANEQRATDAQDKP